MGNWQLKYKKNLMFALIPGIVIGLMLVVGYYTKRENGFVISLNKLGWIALFSLICVLLITAFFILLDKITSNKKRDSIPFFNAKIKKSSNIYFIFTFATIVLWIPVFLAFYPGLFVYDAQWQYFMYVNGEVTTHHPVIHTYLLGWLIDTVYTFTGQFNKGVMTYTLVQMVIMALGCGFFFYEFHRRKAATWLYIFTLCLFAFFPTIVIFVFSSTKDSLFAVAVADFFLLNLSLLEDPKNFFEVRSNRILWGVFALEVCILRSNAIYAIMVTLPFFIVFLVKAKENKKKAFMILGVTIILLLIYKYPVSNALTVGKTSKAEMLSVPCQQIMRVYKYHYDDLSAAEIKAVEELFDSEKWYGYYVPEIADATKGSLRMDVYNGDSSAFWNLWEELLTEYPSEYIDSFLENTYGFWYPWPHYIIYSYGGEGYTPITAMEPAEVNSKFPTLLSFYKNFENGSVVQTSSGISWLFAPATYMYITLICAFYILKDKKLKLCIPFIFVGLLWCTYLLGPAAMVRYALYLYFIVPVLPEYIGSEEKR